MTQRRGTTPVIVNKTSFRGDDLRAFVAAGIRSKNAAGHVALVEFRWSPGFRTTGACWIEDHRVLLNVPRGFDARCDVVELAQVYEHEIDHCFGLEHTDMPDWWTLDVLWARGFRLRQRSSIGPRLADAYEREIRRLTRAMDLVWTPRDHKARVMGSTKRRRRR